MEKKWNISLICVLIIFCIVSFFVLYEKKDDSKNMEYASIDSSKKALVINKALPLSDEAASDLLKKQNIDDDYSVYIDFTVSAKEKCNYKLLINKNEDSNSLENKYIKVLLFDGDSNKIIKEYDGASYLTLDRLDVFNDKYILDESKLAKNKTKHYKLVMWTSDSYVVSSKKEYFNGILDVYSY